MSFAASVSATSSRVARRDRKSDPNKKPLSSDSNLSPSVEQSVCNIEQINLHHSIDATREARRRMDEMENQIILVQEPYWYNGSNGWGLSYNVFRGGLNTDRPRACIICRKSLNLRLIPQISSKDIVACLFKFRYSGQEKSVVICSAYLPYDRAVPTPELQTVVNYCQSNNLPVLIGCDANSHNLIWGSTNTNSRGVSLLEFIVSQNLEILNEGNRPTFIDRRREEVIDLTLCSSGLERFIDNWHVSLESSLSDHQPIHFSMLVEKKEPATFRNPRYTKWDKYESSLTERLRDISTDIHNIDVLEEVADHVTSSIIQTYEECCPLRKVKESVPNEWFTPHLADMKKELNTAFNRRKRDPLTHKEVLKRYKKATRKAQRNSWRNMCERCTGTSGMSRLQK